MTTATERELELLLRGEIAAAETYKQVLDGVDDPEAAPLRAILDDHGTAIRELYEQLAALGVEPPTGSGVWGFFARAVQGTARVLGDKVALAALREGERTGLSQYEAALESELLPPNCRQAIADQRIPAQRRHIDVLTRLIDRL